MATLAASARELIESGALAHLVTVNADGSPQVSCIWVGLDGEEIVSAHLNPEQRKLQNVRRDPRVAMTLEGRGVNPIGMQDHLVIHGEARLQEGGAPELLHRLAQVYVGPGTRFPRIDDPPPGVVMRTTPRRVGGHGPWAHGS
jgi:PPOX class probable F420-dependent enzyme